MRFSLQDVKKQIHRRGGELLVSLHFLRPGELRTEIGRLVDYHERQLKRPQRQFSYDDARACIGDYRLAHCLVATLSHWYIWQPNDWTQVLEQIGGEANERLAVEGITSPMHLRLALFNYVNEHHAGFLAAQGRTQALQAFGESYALSLPDLEYLLALDSEEEALLVRNVAQPPSVDEVATLYNQWVFEAALFNASDVHFVIDCNAFGNAQSAALDVGDQLIAPTGVGAIIKRLCFLARKLGVYYDLAYDASAPVNLPLLHLTLYGPQEMTGAPQQYGLRLARLCRMLLGYGTGPQGVKGARSGQKGMLSRALLEADATVHFLQRSYRFVMDSELLNLLPSARESNADVRTTSDASALFDSSIEQSFAEAFSALESGQGVDGWRLEREPEPLLLKPAQGETTLPGIFIPDFALTRAHRRIYVEILGFWTPSYRERKLQKLQQLAGRNDLLLAIPEEARTAFASIASMFPIVWYEGQLSATELLSVMRNHYDDFSERLAQIDVESVRKCVSNEGIVLEQACYALLHCYRRSELQIAAECIVEKDIIFVPGIGLYESNWMERLRNSFVEWIEEVGALPLTDVLRATRERWPVLKIAEDATIEALIALWPEVCVRRSSIFDAVVEMSNRQEVYDGKDDVGAEFIAVPKKVVRERRTAYKKRTTNETAQGDLWGSGEI